MGTLGPMWEHNLDRTPLSDSFKPKGNFCISSASERKWLAFPQARAMVITSLIQHVSTFKAITPGSTKHNNHCLLYLLCWINQISRCPNKL